MSEPPRSTIRRTAPILAASCVLLVVVGVPAWAGSSFTQPEDGVLEADADQSLTLTVTEPEAEEYGDTARVVVRAPTGFAVLACGDAPLGWACTVAEDGTGVTFVRTSPVSLGVTSRDFGFSVHTPAINGQYAFRVTQADGPPNEEEPPATVSSRPAVTVTGGQDPAPEPEPTPPADDGSSQTGTDGSTAGGTTGGDTDQDAGATSDDREADSDEASSDDGSTSGGSTAPRRTQGRTSGTLLEITPGEQTDDDPAVAPPNVADDPATAPPDDDADDSTAVAATGTQPSDDPGDGPPWQQLVGAAMLLVGVAVVAIRRWDLAGRLQGSQPLALLRRWRGG